MNIDEQKALYRQLACQNATRGQSSDGGYCDLIRLEDDWGHLMAMDVESAADEAADEWGDSHRNKPTDDELIDLFCGYGYSNEWPVKYDPYEHTGSPSF